MAVSVVDLFEVIDINDRDHRFEALLPEGEKLQVKQILPRPMIEQAGETVGTAQGAKTALVVGELNGQAITDPAQR
ncbi:hypothetical protein D3C80_1226920 [compost metagenome]